MDPWPPGKECVLLCPIGLNRRHLHQAGMEGVAHDGTTEYLSV